MKSETHVVTPLIIASKAIEQALMSSSSGSTVDHLSRHQVMVVTDGCGSSSEEQTAQEPD